MRNLISVAIATILLAQLFQSAFASDISSPKEGYLLLSGEIQKGDAEKLANAYMQAPAISLGLILDSPGGDVEEAMRIVSLTKALHFYTFVQGGGICASACFFIYLAGDMHTNLVGTIAGEKSPIPLGFIGLHRPHLKLDPATRNGSIDAEARQHAVMKIISAYLRNEDVPQRLIDLMMSRPSNDIYWMTQDDIEQLGEYSPSHEELLISRCGYSRNLNNEITMERLSNDSAVAARGEARLRAFSVCSVDAFPDLIEERAKNMERLFKGWRPWLNQKVRGKRK